MLVQKKWWKEEVIYQIYPRSFQDSNGDGIGDIPGIISRLDYLKDLGVDIIWLGPVYKTPNDDNGYDISNYYEIEPEFGTMDDFDHLLKGLKERGMRLVMDIVLNHSSDEHEWFEQSRESKDNAFRDYYIWKEGNDGLPPNNWLSFFGGSAWEYDQQTDEYYLHLFTKKQPDLNWENPELRRKLYDIMLFWLDKGIDGFRMDVISLISKRQDFAYANFKSFGQLVETTYANGPRVHEFIQEMYTEVLARYDVMTVGEGPGITKDVGLDYVGADRAELNMIFHLEHMFLGFGPRGRFDPVPYNWDDIKMIIRDWDDAMGEQGWISVFLDNHDFPRMVSRFGNDHTFRIESAKMLAMMVLTLKGTPCIYQGSEIAMTNVQFNSIDQFRDIETINFYKEFSGEGMSDQEFIELANQYGRDNVRTPMQWDATAHGGFSTCDPWIAVNPNYREINVLNAKEDPDSVYYFYKALLEIRKKSTALKYGKWQELNQSDSNVYVYTREAENEKLLIVLNHSDNLAMFEYSAIEQCQILLSNYKNSDSRQLKAWECRLYRI